MEHKKLYLYIHVPFCKNKCPYCTFYSIEDFDIVEAYIKTVTDEINFYSSLFDFNHIESIYIGGGTPSLLSPEDLETLLKGFSINKNTEITIETNPESLTQEKLKFYKESGINRLSVGIQSCLDRNLSILGRNHRVSQIYKILDYICSVDFKNINFDFIYNIPGQTPEDLNREFDFIKTYNPRHLSFYGLILEEDTDFFNMYNQKTDEDLYRDMYLTISEKLISLGYEHYEISNFCKPGYLCRHNWSYWDFSEYLALGPSGSSYINGKRFKNPDSFGEYIKNIENKKLAIEDPEERSREDILLEKIFLSLRKNSGLDLKELSEEYNFNPDSIIKKLHSFLPHEFYYIKNNIVCLTAEGFLMSNTVILDLYEEILRDKKVSSGPLT
ncbi:MAG: radical SAM family heme chaperone HemW [Candidatus Eremiobacterota bacterium]